jgi:hypothetical protein
MATLTIQVKLPQVVDSYEVELPYYCKCGASFFSIKSETEVIQVSLYRTIHSAHIYTKNWLPTELDKFETETITRDEFIEALNEANSLVSSMV